VKIIIIVLVVLLSGCAATKNSYIEPKATEKNTATIVSSFTRNSLADWAGYNIATIDDKSVSYGIMDRDWVTFHITSGAHKLVVAAEFNTGFGGACPCSAFSEVSFNAEAGKNYKLVGEIKGVTVKFWVVDKDTNAIISEVATSAYGSSQRTNFVPIYIPK
jgi:uncharacterized protein YceK